jgi:hypothetical protein
LKNGVLSFVSFCKFPEKKESEGIFHIMVDRPIVPSLASMSFYHLLWREDGFMDVLFRESDFSCRKKTRELPVINLTELIDVVYEP